MLALLAVLLVFLQARVIHLCCALNRFTLIVAMLSKSTCKLAKTSNLQVTACELCLRLCLRPVSSSSSLGNLWHVHSI